MTPRVPDLREAGEADPGEQGYLANVRGDLIPHAATVRAWLIEAGRVVRWDMLSRRIELDGRPLDDADAIRLVVECSLALGIPIGRIHVDQGLASLAHEHPYSPVVEYLDGLEWDGTPRIDTWLSRLAGAEDTPLHRAYARRTLVGAVARARRPGCQRDEVLVLAGAQGARKSSLLRALFGEWCESSRFDAGDPRRGPSALQGVWGYELQEIEDYIGTGERAAAVKSFLSTATDHYQPLYERHVIDRPRACVLVGTTNRADILRDATGSRRFWIVPVGLCDDPAVLAERDQLWAEADAAYQAGEHWHLSPEEDALREAAAGDWSEPDPWAERIESTLGRSGAGHSLAEVLTAIGVPAERQSPRDARRVADILRAQGWSRVWRRVDGARRRVWVRDWPAG